MTQATSAPVTTMVAQMPSGSLLANLRQELARYTPFSQMEATDLDFFLSHVQQLYFAPGETLIEPDSGEVKELFFIRQGAVSGKRGLADLSGGPSSTRPAISSPSARPWPHAP